MKRKQIVAIGGGTGTFTILSGLKKHPVDLAAVVAMADDGGSTGVLRDEMGVLPPGDIRQCLVALSEEDVLMRALMNYRFENGGLQGHSFGNLLLSALEKITGSFEEAIEKAAEILRIDGKVIPATLDNVKLVAEANGHILYGEKMIDTHDLTDLTRILLQPKATANPRAVEAIRHADAIVIGPGDLYTSLLQILLIEGIAKAIRESKAKRIFVCNLMNKKGHTDGFSVQTFADRIEHYLGGPLDLVLFNSEKPSVSLVSRYAREGTPVAVDRRLPKDKFVGSKLLRNGAHGRQDKTDRVRRTFIRHDPERLAALIMENV